ncbi:MAG: hypothetical protein JWN48_244 [Myxococcaceae bacterium]|nr:hypothetical protein [Myxococcaceae bacterium]
MRVPYEPGTSYRWPVTPPPVGACLGGNCQNLPSAAEYARARPQASPMPPGPRARTVPRRQRFAYTGAVLGSSSAALVLGGSIGIALANDIPSERVSRGVWLGYVAVATPLVAMSSWLASRESGYQGFKAVRRVGWLAYGLAVSDGALLWSSAFRHVYSPRLLTIGAGVFGVFALLPHALDALNAARSLRSKRLQQRLHVTGTGLLLRF